MKINNPMPNKEMPNKETPAKKPPTRFHLKWTDSGNADWFTLLFKDLLRYSKPEKTWYLWKSTHWQPDTTGEILNLAMQAIRVVFHEASVLEEGDTKISFLKFLRSCENVSRLAAMLKLASSKDEIRIDPSAFNRDSYLLNCINGTIDLHTGVLQPHNPLDLITKRCNTTYDPTATSKLWTRFLTESTHNTPGMLEFLHRISGYSITGDTSESKLFFIHGPTASGKSTFIESIKATLGDYSQTADFETFLHRSQVGGVRNDIACLKDTRFVSSIEVDEGKKLAEGLIKMITGGDTVRARLLYQESFEFLPNFKLWLAANHSPRINDKDDAMWRRILRLPFIESVPEDKRDPTLKSTLSNPAISGPAILNWLVSGCLEWQTLGLSIPASIQAATTAYRDEMDPLHDFFEECCKLGPYEVEPISMLRMAYDHYARSIGIKFTLSAHNFNNRIKDRQCTTSNRWLSGKVRKCWIGISLHTNVRNDLLEKIGVGVGVGVGVEGSKK